jgi:hypothetical protein
MIHSNATARLRAPAWMLLAVLSLFAWTGGAAAAPGWMSGGQNPVEPQTLVRPSGITRDQAANMVQRETGGRVLSATPAERGGQRGYEVRVLVDGKRVKSVFVDSEGRIRSRN